MTAQALTTFLDSQAIPLAKTKSIQAWISPRARRTHLANRRQTKQFAALFTILDDALRWSGAQLNTVSQPTRVTNTELPKLAFWFFRPTAGGPVYLLAVHRSSEDRNWQFEFEQAYNQL
jgi:hypothetical protein